MKISMLIVSILCILTIGYIGCANQKKEHLMTHDTLNSSSVAFPGYYDLRLGGEDALKNWIVTGGNVNMVNDEGDTPLHVAVGPAYEKIYDPERFEEVEIMPSVQSIKLLLDAGAQVNAKDRKGATPLYRAVLWGDTKILNLLLAHGADINIKALEGDTPLHVAAIHGASKSKWLLEHGAEVNAKNKRGDTPLSLAQKYNHVEIINLLKSAGAKE